MTRSPFTATLIPLIPLAALGWPLARVLNLEPYQQVQPIEKENTGPVIAADLFIKSAHPFEKIEVSDGEGGPVWTFAPDDEIKEIFLPKEDEIFLKVTVVWPLNTPESAVLLTLRANGREDRTHTLWGDLEVTEEIKFTWDPEL